MDVLDLDDALEPIGQIKPRYQGLVELRFFGGIELEEIGEVLGISRSIVARE